MQITKFAIKDTDGLWFHRGALAELREICTKSRSLLMEIGRQGAADARGLQPGYGNHLIV